MLSTFLPRDYRFDGSRSDRNHVCFDARLVDGDPRPKVGARGQTMRELADAGEERFPIVRFVTKDDLENAAP
jgi:hypothetical protein